MLLSCEGGQARRIWGSWGTEYLGWSHLQPGRELRWNFQLKDGCRGPHVLLLLSAHMDLLKSGFALQKAERPAHSFLPLIMLIITFS